MVPLDRAFVGKFLYAVSSNHVAICSGLAAICNAKFLPAPCSWKQFLVYLLIPEVDDLEH